MASLKRKRAVVKKKKKRLIYRTKDGRFKKAPRRKPKKPVKRKSPVKRKPPVKRPIKRKSPVKRKPVRRKEPTRAALKKQREEFERILREQRELAEAERKRQQKKLVELENLLYLFDNMRVIEEESMKPENRIKRMKSLFHEVEWLLPRPGQTRRDAIIEWTVRNRISLDEFWREYDKRHPRRPRKAAA